MEPKIIVVDEDDNIIGHKFRADVDREGLRYRVSALWITNSQGKILLARRAYTKSHDPGMWGPAVAGTVDEGETYEDNIIKEAKEELGLFGLKLKKEFKRVRDGKHKHFTQWFSAVVDKQISQFKLQEDEVAEVKWFTRKEIEDALDNDDERFLGSIREILERFS